MKTDRRPRRRRHRLALLLLGIQLGLTNFPRRDQAGMGRSEHEIPCPECDLLLRKVWLSNKWKCPDGHRFTTGELRDLDLI
jgi:hypothetical protein